MKRGQVTQFIIAGLIILIAIIFVMIARFDYLKDLFEEQKAKFVGVPSDIEPVKEYIKNCLNEVSPMAETLVLVQGGYYEPSNYIVLDITDVALWYNNGVDVSPSLSFIGSEMAKAVDFLLPLCINEFDVSGYDLDIKNIDTNVMIRDKEIVTSSKVNVYVGYKDINFTIDDKFNDKMKSSLYDVYSVAMTIVDLEVREPESIEITTLADLGYDINFIRYNENEMVHMIPVDNSTLFIGSRF